MDREMHIACPQCGWEPDGGAYWSCHCGHRWNTFETAGRCPQCGQHWKDTQCVPHKGGCWAWSPHIDWYHDLDQWLQDEWEETMKEKSDLLTNQ